MMQPSDIKADLTQSLRNLHLPTVRQCYEDVARQAEREQLSYERYLHELVQRECEDRQENRTTKMLRESQLPLEKSLEAFDTRRLPPKAARQMVLSLMAVSWSVLKMSSCSGIPGAAKRTCCRPWGRN
jgi:DNA replication protein DnaC